MWSINTSIKKNYQFLRSPGLFSVIQSLWYSNDDNTAKQVDKSRQTVTREVIQLINPSFISFAETPSRIITDSSQLMIAYIVLQRIPVLMAKPIDVLSSFALRKAYH